METIKPLVSVIINNYNYGEFIEEAINSVLNQTYPQDKIEIIVVDDGSTDDTAQRVAKYGDKIKFISKENGGQGTAFNVGFEHSAGKIIFLLDADDIFYPEKIEKVCRIYQTYDCSSTYNNLEFFGNTIEKYENPRSKYLLQFLDKVDKNIYKCSAKHNTSSFLFLAQTSGQSYKREVLQKIFPVPVSYRYDLDLYLHALFLVHEDIYYLDELLTGYRQHNKSFSVMCESGNLKRRQEEIEFFKDTAQILRGLNNDKAEYLYNSLINSIIYLNYTLEKFRKNKPKAFYYLLKYKTTPKSLLKKMWAKTNYILDLLLPKAIYSITRDLYKNSMKVVEKIYLKKEPI